VEPRPSALDVAIRKYLGFIGVEAGEAWHDIYLSFTVSRGTYESRPAKFTRVVAPSRVQAQVVLSLRILQDKMGAETLLAV
jgi:hypothetical protein